MLENEELDETFVSLFLENLANILGVDNDPDSIEAEVRKLVFGNELSKRGKEWVDFSAKVLYHIETYTVPQYGDMGEDQITHYNAEECVLQNRKYAARFGRNRRDGQDTLDLLKSAHYSCIAHSKLVQSKAEKLELEAENAS